MKKQRHWRYQQLSCRSCNDAGCLQTTVWICAFSINQHASICGGFGPEPVGDPEAFAVFETWLDFDVAVIKHGETHLQYLQARGIVLQSHTIPVFLHITLDQFLV